MQLLSRAWRHTLVRHATLAVLGLPAVQLGSLLGAGVGLVVGAACAWRFVARISAATVRSLVLVLAAVGGVLLITRALT